MKEKIKNPFVQQYALEILLPLLGYFFFNWTLTIIGIFYLLDQMASELIFFRRIFWINKHSPNSQKKGIFIVLAILSFMLLFGAIVFIFVVIWPLTINSTSDEILLEFITFSKEELWLLFPLIIAMYYLKDLFTFYMPRRYLQHNLKKAVLGRTILNTGILILVGLGILLLQHITGHEILILISFLFIKILFDFSIGKWATHYSKIV